MMYGFGFLFSYPPVDYGVRILKTGKKGKPVLECKVATRTIMKLNEKRHGFCKPSKQKATPKRTQFKFGGQNFSCNK